MPVGSPLEMYTTVLGWHIFTGFWELLAHTGLVLIPFGWMALDNMIEARRSASKTDVGVRAFRRTEVEMIVAFAVMYLFAVPTINLRPATVEYIHSSCELSGAARLERKVLSQPFGATRSTYDQNVGDPVIAILDGSQPRIPPVWFLMTRYMRAIPEALKQRLPCNPDLRLLSTDLQNAAVEDPLLRDELGMFQRDCWHPSVNRFTREKPSVPNDYDDIRQDISWSGSRFFLTTPGYYDNFRASEPLTSFQYDIGRDENRMTSDQAQGRGMPYCFEWWESSSEGLRERLLTDAGMDTNFNWQYISQRVFGQSTREARDALLYGILSMDTTIRANKLTNSYPRDSFLGSEFLGQGTGNLKAVGSTIGLGLGAPVLYTSIYVMKQAAPIFQAIIIMFIVLMLPVLLTISGFQLKPAIALMFTLASIHFWSFIFAFAHWVDTSLWSGATGNTRSSMSSLLDLTQGSTFLVFDYVVGALYIALPVLLTSLISVVGMKVGDQVAGRMGEATQSTANKGGSGAKLKGGGK